MPIDQFDRQVRGFQPGLVQGRLHGERPADIGPALGRRLGAGGAVDGVAFPLRAALGQFDVVVALYHDQGMIPAKMMSQGHAVNVTLGLPVIRTSVDHGTAFDIARRGIANADSMVEAIEVALQMAAEKEAAA